MLAPWIPYLLLAGVLRPAAGSPAHHIEELDTGGASRDGWGTRALVRDRDGAVVVLGAARSAPRPVEQTPAYAAHDAVAAVAALGWPGATDARFVITRAGRAAWRVDPPASLRGPSNPVFLVDAATGEVSLRHDRVLHEQVRSFAINPIVTPNAEDFDLLDFDATLADGDLRGERIAVFNCVEPAGDAICGYSTAPPSDGANFLHPAPDITDPDDNVQLEDYFAVQSVHYHAERFMAWLDGLGTPALPCDATGDPLVLIANYKAYIGDETLLIGNAAFIGDCQLTASFGQGPYADWGYDGEVVYHELTHGLVESAMGGDFLGLIQPRGEAVLRDAGTINEATADFFASAFTDDPVHGEYISQVGSGQGRRLDNDLTCPRSLTGEIHFDGELWGGMLWDAYGELGEPFLLAVVDAIGLLQEDASFEEASAALIGVVGEELGTEAAATLEEIVAARGLDDCQRVVSWDELERALWLRPRGQAGKFDPLQPPPLQLAVDVPEDAGGFVLRFAWEALPSAGFSPTTELHALIRHGTPHQFDYELDGDLILVDADIDEHIPLIHDLATGEGVVVEAPSGQTTYVALFNQSPNITLVTEIDVQLTEAPAGDGSTGDPLTGGPELPDDGTGANEDPVDPPSSTCACRPQPTRPRAWLLLLALISLVRRRATRRPSGGLRCAARGAGRSRTSSGDRR